MTTSTCARSRLVLGAVAVATGVALTSAAAPSAAAAGPAWSLSLDDHCAQYRCGFDSVSATAPDDAWALSHDEGTNRVRHWDGTGWQDGPGLADRQVVNSLSAVSDHDVWLGGYEGDQPLTLHWDGSHLTKVPIPAGDDPRGFGVYVQRIAATPDGGVWATGAYMGDANPLVRTWRWTGSAWAIVPFTTDLRDGGVEELVAVSRTDAWLLGQSDVREPVGPARFTVWHATGSGWRAVPDGNLSDHSFGSAMVVRGGTVYVGGRHDCRRDPTGCRSTPFLRAWNGTAWRTLRQPPRSIEALAVDGHGGLDAALDATGPTPRFAHWNGSAWSASRGPDLRGQANTTELAHVPGTRDTWAIGDASDETDTDAYVLLHHG